MQATPITWKMLLEAGWDGNPPLKVLCGGEAFPRELANELTKRATSVWNMYGPTETTIWSATAEVKPGELRCDRASDRQYPILRVGWEWTAGPARRPGELHIGGDGLARGYFHRPE